MIMQSPQNIDKKSTPKNKQSPPNNKKKKGKGKGHKSRAEFRKNKKEREKKKRARRRQQNAQRKEQDRSTNAKINNDPSAATSNALSKSSKPSSSSSLPPPASHDNTIKHQEMAAQLNATKPTSNASNASPKQPLIPPESPDNAPKHQEMPPSPHQDDFAPKLNGLNATKHQEIEQQLNTTKQMMNPANNGKENDSNQINTSNLNENVATKDYKMDGFNEYHQLNQAVSGVNNVNNDARIANKTKTINKASNPTNNNVNKLNKHRKDHVVDVNEEKENVSIKINQDCKDRLNDNASINLHRNKTALRIANNNEEDVSEDEEDVDLIVMVNSNGDKSNVNSRTTSATSSPSPITINNNGTMQETMHETSTSIEQHGNSCIEPVLMNVTSSSRELNAKNNEANISNTKSRYPSIDFQTTKPISLSPLNTINCNDNHVISNQFLKGMMMMMMMMYFLDEILICFVHEINRKHGTPK